MTVIWEATLDQIYEVKVVRTGTSTGEFSVSQGGKVIHSEPVDLAYGAQFGPDVADVADWQEKALSIVDGQE